MPLIFNGLKFLLNFRGESIVFHGEESLGTFDVIGGEYSNFFVNEETGEQEIEVMKKEYIFDDDKTSFWKNKEKPAIDTFGGTGAGVKITLTVKNTL